MTEPLVWSGPLSAADAAAALPYPGEDPASLAVVTSRISDARSGLARVNDALFDARTAIAAAWRGTTGALGEAEVGRLEAAIREGAGRLDQCRSALYECIDALAAVREAIAALRWTWLAAERRVRACESAVALCLDPVQLSVLTTHRDLVRNERTAVVRAWGREVTAANEATGRCADRIRRSLTGDLDYVSGRGVVAEGLAAAIGTDELVVDDVFLDATQAGFTRWDRLSGVAQTFALAAAGTFPPPGAGPAAVATAWRARTPMQQQALLHADPGRIGALDGVTAAARDQANRLALSTREAQLLASLHALPTPAPRSPPVEGSWSSYGYYPENSATAAARTRESLTGELQNLRAITAQLPSIGTTPRFLLDFDLAGRGRAVVALGNPDLADAVATYVPGTGSDLAGLGTEIDRSMTMMDSVDGPQSTAVVAWLGYVSPAAVPDAAFDLAGDLAAPDLVAFQAGLRASHLGDRSLNTVVGYSYGGFVVGTAASGEVALDADQLVFLASAGLEVDSVDALHLVGVPPAEIGDRVFATAYSNDIIRATAIGHSNLPTDLEFGASIFLAGEYEAATSPPWWVGVATPALIGVLGPALGAHSVGNWTRGAPPMVGTGAVIAGRRPPTEVPRR